MKIDLIVSCEWMGDWAYGSVYKADFTISGLQSTIQQVLEKNSEGYVYCFNGTNLPDATSIQHLTSIPRRIYTGATVAFPNLLSYSVPLSFFNFQPFNAAQEHTTWLISFENCLLDKALLASGFLDSRFYSLEGAGAYWALQQIYAGAIIRFYPALVSLSQAPTSIPFTDQVRIASYFMGFKWTLWTSLRLLLSGNFGRSLRGFLAAFLLKSQKPIPVPVQFYPEWKRAAIPDQPKVSVLIPTVDRYPYLFTMLDQLREQTVKPFEVLVIDQTKQELRRPVQIPELPIMLFTLDEAGQCRSRNLGLQHARGDYILFLDDDDEVYPHLIEDHLRTLSYFNADVSCGLCHEPGQSDIPKNFELLRVADIFSTNNGMIRRPVLQRTGLFDMVYDRGQKADGDLGARMHRCGMLMLINPEIKVLHHRAPSGGLRKHNVRRITYTSSRSFITHFRLPHVTELYFNLKNLTALQQREYLWHCVIGTFSIRGHVFLKLCKMAWALTCLPINAWKLHQRKALALQLIKNNPPIETLAGFPS